MNKPTPTLSPQDHTILGQLVEAMANNDQTLFDSLLSSCNPSQKEMLIAILFKLNPHHPFLRKYLSTSQKMQNNVANIGDFLERTEKQRTEPAEPSIAIINDEIAKNRTQNDGSEIGNKTKPD